MSKLLQVRIRQYKHNRQTDTGTIIRASLPYRQRVCLTISESALLSAQFYILVFRHFDLLVLKLISTEFYEEKLKIEKNLFRIVTVKA